MYKRKNYRTVVYIDNEPVKGFGGKRHLDWINETDWSLVAYPIDKNVIPDKSEFFVYAITFDIEGMNYENFGEIGPESDLFPIMVERVSFKNE